MAEDVRISAKKIIKGNKFVSSEKIIKKGHLGFHNKTKTLFLYHIEINDIFIMEIWASEYLDYYSKIEGSEVWEPREFLMCIESFLLSLLDKDIPTEEVDVLTKQLGVIAKLNPKYKETIIGKIIIRVKGVDALLS